MVERRDDLSWLRDDDDDNDEVNTYRPNVTESITAYTRCA